MVTLDVAIKITCKSFEGADFGTVTGNFDGMGISAGCLQFNLGTGTLQGYILRHLNLMYYDFPVPIIPLVNGSNQNAVQWATDVMLDGKRLKPEWLKAWQVFMTKPEVINLQKTAVGKYMHRAKEIVGRAGFKQDNHHAMCWAFDIAVQNWSFDIQEPLPNESQARNIFTIYQGANAGLWIDQEMNSDQIKMVIMSHLRALKSKPEWRSVVFARKATIAMKRGWVNKTLWDFTDCL